MNRRSFLGEIARFAAAVTVLPLVACRSGSVPRGAAAIVANQAAGLSFEPLDKSESQWRELLTPSQYEILFEEGTEPAGSSPLNDEHREGLFLCAACYLPLFDSKAKFDSGTGWPSFTAPIDGRVGTKADYELLVPRTEYHCARCGGHQGHVFDDGPPPTGQRWCNNGLALRFISADQELPALRS